MKTETLQQFKQSDRYKTVMQRSLGLDEKIDNVVKQIIADVSKRGDDALREYTKQYEQCDIMDFKVPADAVEIAYEKIDDTMVAALQLAANNITAVYKDQLPQSVEKSISPLPGVTVWRKWRPFDRIGAYVPGGKAVYPSSVLMNIIPAKVAGCGQNILITPPQSDGTVNPIILVAADIAGADEIYLAGGAQAIAALAYGTDSIPRVDKIVGPGNSYVTAAKMQVAYSGKVAIDSPAGPSEVLVIADETANPEFVAADIICDTEHGEDSAGVLVTTSFAMSQAVILAIEQQLKELVTAERVKKSLAAYGAFLVADDIDQAVDFANEYASEHTLIQTANSKAVADRITVAGSVFVGPYTCKSAGDYATGANHVLPTGGGARSYSGLSVLDFVRLVEYQEVTKAGLQSLRSTIETLATAEQLPAHKQSCSIRFNN